MDQSVKDYVIQKVKEMTESPTCCAEAKAAGQRWLEAVGTEKEAEETRNLCMITNCSHEDSVII